MPRLHVCSLPRLAATTRETGASHVMTLIKNIAMAPTPDGIHPDRHLRLDFADIVEPREGEVPPGPEHVREIIRFARSWDRAAPMVVHCFAGVSRSTAGAFISACLLMPGRDEHELARHIRLASPTATPNARLIAFADAMLERDGRMIAAIQSIGRGEECYEGVPFHIDIA